LNVVGVKYFNEKGRSKSSGGGTKKGRKMLREGEPLRVTSTPEYEEGESKKKRPLTTTNGEDKLSKTKGNAIEKSNGPTKRGEVKPWATRNQKKQTN